MTIDHFFRSLAEAQHERALCVVMSGTGSDGTLGLRAIKGEGGLVIAQSPNSTEYDGMPRSAIATGMVDCVLPPDQIPAQLIAYARHAFDPDRATAKPATRESLLKRLCVLLRAQTGHDFRQYKETTLIRRMERRMALHQLESADDYLRYARAHPPEVDALFRDLLIGVTSFFRDPDAFRVLQEKVLPKLVEKKPADDAVRIWVCGCSTGEEAYSLAMLLYEQILESKRPLKVQVFATDIDVNAIEHARAGVYPASIAADVSEERLARFFIHESQRGTYRIQKHIRDMLVFSEQDVIKDPPFSKLDIVSCRNLLIYLTTELQKKLIPLFYYALIPDGVLFLGSAETVGESARLFHVVDRKWKIYLAAPVEAGVTRPPLSQFAPSYFDHVERPHPPRLGGDHASGTLRQVTEQALLAHYAQAAVLVDGRGQILHILGRTGHFLEPAAGDAAMNILPMARDGLRRELTVGLHKAVAHKKPIVYTGLRVRANGGFITANLAVRPIQTGDGENRSILYLVILEECPQTGETVGAPKPRDEHSERIHVLEQELRSKDEYLQTTLEEMETTNEELKSTNEEMQSVNEELQSTNEELETSKEELQSVNEELSTVNAELQDKVADLSRANDDMNNLLAGTGVGTLFVDHQLRIARFTPSITQVINLINSDLGRPLEHVAANVIGYDAMVEDIQTVLDTVVTKEAEVQVKNGNWFLMRIRPYRTIDNLISETDLSGNFLFVNDRLCQMTGFSREDLLQSKISNRMRLEEHRLLCLSLVGHAETFASRPCSSAPPEVRATRSAAETEQ